MSKYGLILVFTLILYAPQLHPQNKSENQYATQLAAAEQETVVNIAVDDMRARMQQKLIARSVAERQVQLRQDTEKAQEIEELAKSVKDKMRDAY